MNNIFIDNLIIVAGQVLTLFMMMAVGFVLRKKRKLGDEALSQMTYILLKIIAPCIIIGTLQIERDMSLLRNIGLTALSVLAYFLISGVLSKILFRKKAPDTRAVLEFGTIYPNSGFMGLPLVQACLGDGAMLYAGIFLVVFTLVHWTHGVLLMDKGEGTKGSGIRNALLNPGTIGFGAGFVLFIFNAKLPEPVGNALDLLGGINSPLAMIVIGAQIADADVLKLFKQAELYLASIAKLIILPAITALILIPLNLPPIVYCTVVILTGAPTAAVTAMFASQFNRDATTAARLVSLGTLLSILTLPVLAAIVKSVSGI